MTCSGHCRAVHPLLLALKLACCHLRHGSAIHSLLLALRPGRCEGLPHRLAPRGMR